MKRKFYHATTEEEVQRFLRSNLLLPADDYFFKHKIKDDHLILYTSQDEAKKHGCVLIEVEYNPLERTWSNNWKENEFWHREYMPIPSKYCKVLS